MVGENGRQYWLTVNSNGKNTNPFLGHWRGRISFKISRNIEYLGILEQWRRVCSRKASQHLTTHFQNGKQFRPTPEIRHKSRTLAPVTALAMEFIAEIHCNRLYMR